MRVTDLPTPQVLVDQSRLQANIRRMQEVAASHGLRLRPHAKTHKIPAIAAMQIDAGATGICCAKPGEAEVFAAAGIGDIRLPYPVHPSCAQRMLALMEQARVSIIVDHLKIAREWSQAMQRAGKRLDVLVKVDVGFHRCGIDPEAGAVEFLEAIANLPALTFRGLLSHAGHAYGAASEQDIAGIARDESIALNELAASARARGIAIDEISVGATPTAGASAREVGLTELRPGNYVYYDRTQVGLRTATVRDCALTVLARVVSKPAADRLILDAGSKTLTTDPARGFGPVPGFGAIFTDLEATALDETLLVERLSEEHATVRVLPGETRLEPGDFVRVLPNHACVVSNLVDCIRLVEGVTVVETLPIAARGRIN
jgi:D-serine deaminase-like pyridoxal phosphate-dependent protein